MAYAEDDNRRINAGQVPDPQIVAKSRQEVSRVVRSLFKIAGQSGESMCERVRLEGPDGINVLFGNTGDTLEQVLDIVTRCDPGYLISLQQQTLQIQDDGQIFQQYHGSGTETDSLLKSSRMEFLMKSLLTEGKNCMTLPEPELTDPIDTQTVRAQVAGCVKKFFGGLDSKDARISCKKEGDRFQVYIGRTGSSEDEVLDVVEKSHPRYIEMAVRNTPDVELPLKVSPKEPGIVAVASEDANNLLSSLLTLGKDSIGKKSGDVLHTLFNTPEQHGEGAIEFLRFRDEDKLAFLKFIGFPSARCELGSTRLTRLFEYRQRYHGIYKAMEAKKNEIVQERTDAGFPDDRAGEYWTDEKVGAHDPTEFWNEKRVTNLETRDFIALRAEIAGEWSGLVPMENTFYSQILTEVSNMAVSRLVQMHGLMNDVVGELQLTGKVASAINTYTDAQTAVDPDSSDFNTQLRTLRDNTCEYLRLYDTAEKWGWGQAADKLMVGSLAVIKENPDVVKMEIPSRRILDQWVAGISDAEQYREHQHPYSVELPKFIDDIIEIDGKNHPLAKSIWRALRPADAHPLRNYPICIQLLVTRDYSTPGCPRPPRDYPSIVRPLLKANADKPYILEYAAGFLAGEEFDDYNIFNGYLTQEYFDGFLDRLSVDEAKGVCQAFNLRHSKRYLVPDNPDGKKVLDAAVANPGLMNPIRPNTDNWYSNPDTVAYLECLESDLHRPSLIAVTGKHYQDAYAFAFVDSDEEQRRLYGMQGFIQFLGIMDDSNPSYTQAYLNMLARPEDRDMLLSPNIQGMIVKDPRIAGPLAAMHSSDHLGFVGRFLMDGSNTDFFTYEKLCEIADKASRPETWPIAEAALKQLGAIG